MRKFEQKFGYNQILIMIFSLYYKTPKAIIKGIKILIYEAKMYCNIINTAGLWQS